MLGHKMGLVLGGRCRAFGRGGHVKSALSGGSRRDRGPQIGFGVLFDADNGFVLEQAFGHCFG